MSLFIHFLYSIVIQKHFNDNIHYTTRKHNQIHSYFEVTMPFVSSWALSNMEAPPLFDFVSYLYRNYINI